MKKIMIQLASLGFSLLISVVMLSSCRPKPRVGQVDLNAAKAAVIEAMDKQYAAFAARDAKTGLSFLTEDAMTLGTDPKEFWTKAQQVAMLGQMLADTSLKLDFKPERREVYISADGNSAIVVEQTQVNFISRKVMTRRISHLIRTANGWMIDFDSTSMIPKNEDLRAINKALE